MAALHASLLLLAWSLTVVVPLLEMKNPLIGVLALATLAYTYELEYGLFAPDLEQPLASAEIGIDKSQLFSLHRELVNIESISNNEHNVGVLLESYLKDHNYTVERQYLDFIQSKEKNARFNLLAYPGSKRQTPVLLTSHIDTVPPFYPYTLREKEDIWGRGSVDAKACVATQITALQELLASNAISPNDVSLLYVVGEEVGGDGMHAINDLKMKWDTVIFGEPTELKLASGHKGILVFTLTAHGKAGHSGYPWLGKSANHMLVSALSALQNMNLPSSSKYGNSTLNIGKITGGVAANVIAETAIADIGIRLAAGDPSIAKQLILDTVRDIDSDIEITFHGRGYGPVGLDHDIEGFDTMTVNYGTDVPNLDGNHKRYLYGPGNILVAHSDHEHLSTGDLMRAVEGYKRIIMASLKKEDDVRRMDYGL